MSTAPKSPNDGSWAPATAQRLHLRDRDVAAERPAGVSEDVHVTEALATFAIEHYSRRGDRVLDPFAGYGTTLVVAERLGRVPVGVEILPDRVALVRDRLREPHRIIHGDARRLDTLDIGTAALCLASPPYRNRFDHPEDPLTGYTTRGGSYVRYLAEMRDVFGSIARRLPPDGTFVLNAANVRTVHGLTPLADDLVDAARYSFAVAEAIEIEWDTAPAQLEGDRLVFSPLPR